ncbi:nuclear transport factor 2 family protein [Maridesulfovibrio sp.]|uniref:YybH family protein n=1 Tax=Maridesulfovibrio sp. TaxID=2795000 RepID=UPI0029F54458|nr:nuclear transport factor 2 family protein [Maridesulfovibrio sp.]
MKKILFSMLMLLMVIFAAVSVSASNNEEVRDQIKDVLFEYKDAYNLRDFNAVRALYAKNAVIMSFPCNSKNEQMFSGFSDNLPRCSSYWLESTFKLRLFKITEFKVDGNKCIARVKWDYRSNDGRGKFTPTFEFLQKDGKWLIEKETYGRKSE